MSIESRSNQYGTVFGDWQIKEPLGSGSGGRSMVFRLYRESAPWENGALKVVSLIEERGRLETLPEYRRKEYEAALAECRRRAEIEVRLMADLRGHTNIVDYQDHKFVNWSDASGFGCDLLIRMEQLEDLRTLIQRGETFAEEEIVKIGLDMCSALSLCHRKKILHRDIKPENIFRSRDGDYKLGDFGISRILDSSPTARASTGIGTPEYAAPEQGSGEYDTRVDLYSLGLVLYELGNGNRLPFASSSYVRSEEIQQRQMGLPLPTPGGVGSGLAEVILRACAFRPEERYQSAEEFAAALRSRNPGRATQPMPPPPPPPPPARRGLLIGIVAALAALAVVMCLVLGGVLTARRDKTEADPQPTSSAAVRKETEPPQTQTPTDAPTEAPTQAPTEPPTEAPTEPQTGIIQISAGGWGSYALSAEGIVMATGRNHHGQNDVGSWRNITAISAGDCYIVGLHADGTVEAVGRNNHGQCEVTGWTDIVAVDAGTFHTVGLRSDGTVLAAGRNGDGQCNVSGWSDITQVCAGEYHTVALRSDGTVVAVGRNDSGQCNVSDWTDIIAVSAGVEHTIGLRSDGTVLMVGSNAKGQCGGTGWTDIVAISAGDYHSVGLKSDGTVVAVGDNTYGQLNVSSWRGIREVSARYGHTMGLTEDGRVVAVGWNNFKQCEVTGWS